MDSKKQTNRLVNAIGTTAETSLVFYRAAKGAGATDGEATRLTQAYIAAMAFGKGQPPQQQSAATQQRQEGQQT